MNTALAIGSCVSLVMFIWLLGNALKGPQDRPYVPKQRQEETDKWDDWMNFV